ncbi:MAG: hypothetical protein GY796_26845 [Chloroflexi bacterium]|nr:hypothetical protein [Chloroflexota bacterium]
MTRHSFSIVLLLLLLSITACKLFGESADKPTASVQETATSALLSTDAPSPYSPPTNNAALPTVALPPTAVPTIPPPPTLLPSPTPADDLSLTPDGVHLYPVPGIYTGELVTFQILANVPPHVNPNDVTVHILVDYQDVVSGTLDAANLQGGGVGLFEWAWDTQDAAGDHLIHVILDRYDTVQNGDENRENNQASLTVTIQNSVTLSRSEQNAAWITRESDCCRLHVVSGTAAARDLNQLVNRVETAVSQAAISLDEQPNHKLDVYLIDRVIGQGGYAGYDIVISYLDRSYANNGFQQVMTHEAVHILDRQFAPERISFLAEGVATWASGGHYKPENLTQRSAALITLDEYIPLPQLIDSFYPVQHEIGYLEAAGFVTYLVNHYGWSTFRNFYSDVTREDDDTLSTAVDKNMQRYFNTTLAQAETDWLRELAQLPENNAAVSDLQTTIRFYNVMRRYQQLYDPTAYFLTAWLPPPETLEQKGNPADLTRHPATEINVTLEVMLQAADTAVRQADYHEANILLDSITRVLDNDGAFVDPLAHTYLNVVQTATAAGYEVQQVHLNGKRATVTVTEKNSSELTDLSVILSGQDWVLWN